MNKPETYHEFCERNLRTLEYMDKYEFGELAFIAGQSSGLAHAQLLMTMNPKEKEEWLTKIKTL